LAKRGLKRLTFDEERWWFDRIEKTRDPVQLGHFIRYRSLTNLVFFARVVLGYDLIDDPWHYFIADRQENRRKPYWVCMGPRKTYKSVLCNVAKNIQRVLRARMFKQDMTVLIIGADEEISQARIREIDAHMSQPRFIALWGDMRGKPWSPSDCMLQVTNMRPSADPTFSVGSPGKEHTSKHPKVVTVDDLEAERNAYSEVEREKVKDYYRNIFGLGPKLLDVLNTPWHYAGFLFDDLLNAQKKKYLDYDFVVMPVETDGRFIMESQPTEAPRYEPRQPLMGRDYLEFLTRQWGHMAVMCQMYLWPEGEEDQTFNMELLNENTIYDAPKEMRTWVFVDPSKSAQMDTHDPAGLVVLGYDATGNVNLLDAREIRKDPYSLCMEVFEVAKLWKADTLAVEEAPGVFQYKSQFETLMQQPDYAGPLPLRIRNVRTDKINKHKRIAWLRILWERKRFKIYSGMWPAHKQLWLRQMQAYPIGHDDLLDAAAYANPDHSPRFRPPRERRDLTAQEQTDMEHVRRAREFQTEVMANGDADKLTVGDGVLPNSMLNWRGY